MFENVPPVSSMPALGPSVFKAASAPVPAAFDRGPSAAPERVSNVSKRASVFEEARWKRDGEGGGAGKTAGVAARSAAFSRPKDEAAAEDGGGRPAPPQIAGRASAYERRGEEAEAREAREQRAKKSVFMGSSLDRNSPAAAGRGADGSAVFGTLSGHADARQVTIPRVAVSSAGSTSVAELASMNARLVGTLMQLTAACAKIEQSKEELKERIRGLEAKVELQARREAPAAMRTSSLPF
jgi:hypothetical protein